MSCRDRFVLCKTLVFLDASDFMSVIGVVRSHVASRVILGMILSLSIPIAQAQVTPDNSVGTIVNITGNTADITGGTQQGTNLFHSFSEFSLTSSTVNTARFDNSTGIANIIMRVTGGSISRIDGWIQANGNANLIFLNPNGIIFGEQAALNIGGSFLASTADRLKFGDGTELDTRSTTPPLLTISQPIGLQYGATPAPIRVEGSGHFIFVEPDPFEIVRAFRPVGLGVGTEKTLALIGGRVELQGGNLTAEQGQIEIGAIANSTVSLTSTTSGWNFTYPTNATFQDVVFAQGSSADASGNSGGRVRVQARNVKILDGSSLLALTLGDGTGGLVQVTASESVTLRGEFVFNDFPLLPSSLLTEVNLGATGQGGDIAVKTGRFFATEGAKISSSTAGEGNGGQISIGANTIELQGDSPNFGSTTISAASTGGKTGGNGGLVKLTADTIRFVDSGAIISNTNGGGNAGSVEITARTLDFVSGSEFGASGIFVETFPGSTGRGGNVSIVAEQFQLTDGALLVSSTLGSGDAGALNLKVNRLSISEGAQIVTSTSGSGNADSITITAQTIGLQGADGQLPTGIFASVNPSGTGQGGRLTIDTQRLSVLNGAQIAVDTFGSGNARGLSITAREIELAGSASQGRSGIFAGAIADTGAGGNIFVNSDRLIIRDGATISASNFSSWGQIPSGQGAAGNIDIRANTIRLNNGSINASTVAGGRGNIELRSNILTLLNQSLISTNSQGTEPGGNIVLNTDFLVGFRNSDITANAVNARGGKVTVNAQSLFGIGERDRLTLESDITASSELGIEFNGVVQINTPDIDPTRGLVKLPESVSSAERIAASCEQSKDNAFVVTGRGGLPEDAAQSLRGGTVWEDLRTPTAGNIERPTIAQTSGIPEAQSWVVRSDGQVELVAAQPIQAQFVNCAVQR
ncbi:filamentous hemagglutinin family outer membrane protein [Leptolyngbya sp. NIES-3755]|nr:filamentous hemagglutinin family outer membrane protein [Leptolyngbya sp. NIES-3755]